MPDMIRIACRHRRRQSGTTLIEVLVAVLILAIGMLASARMQMEAMQSSQSALHRSNALLLAEDMVARMRANRAGLEAGAYSAVDTDAEISPSNCLSSGCSVAELAQADIHAWSQDLSASALRLPPRVDGQAARGRVSRAADGLYTVQLDWATSDAGELVDASLELKVRTE